MEASNILLNLIIYVILGITSGMLVKFIDFCFNEGNIFDFYYIFVLWVETKSKKMAKLLGLCPHCYGFWVSSGLFFIYSHIFDTYLIYYIPYISISQFVIYLLFKGEDDKIIF